MSHDSMPTRPAEHHSDVLVIGGGPAGSTAAALSALAGDIFGKTPICRSLLAFKAIYWLTYLASLKRTIMARKWRKLNIPPQEEAEEVGCR